MRNGAFGLLFFIKGDGSGDERAGDAGGGGVAERNLWSEKNRNFLVKKIWICGIITHVWAEFARMLRKAVVYEWVWGL